MFNLKSKLLHFFPPYRKFVTCSSIGNYGRFGNQLFQYSAVRSYSLKNNLPSIIDNAQKNYITAFLTINTDPEDF